MLPGISGIAGVGQTASSIIEGTRGSRYTNTATQKTYSNSFSIGTASSTRRVIAVVTTRYSAFADTVTIGGVAATNHASINSGTGTSDVTVRIYSAIVPTGTTATVSVDNQSADSQYYHPGISIVTVAIDGPEGSTAFSSATDVGSSGLAEQTVSIIPNAFVVAGYINSSAATGVSWTGITEIDDLQTDNWRSSWAIIRPTSYGSLTLSAQGDASFVSAMAASVFI
jgi:hypothetical protein